MRREIDVVYPSRLSRERMERTRRLRNACAFPSIGLDDEWRTSIMDFSRTTGFAGFRPSAQKYDPASRRAALDRLDRLATLFDVAFIVPGTNVRFGVESLLRLVPGIGDALASML